MDFVEAHQNNNISKDRTQQSVVGDNLSNYAMNEDEIDGKDSLRIPIKCTIQSSYEELFNDILEMDGLS